MRAADIERLLVRVTRASASEIDQRTRWLRGVQDLPGVREFRAARGRYAPDLAGWEAAWMLLCLVSKRATDAQGCARWLAGHQAANIPESNGATELVDFLGRVTELEPSEVPFGYVLGIILVHAGFGTSFDIHRIEIVENGVLAWIVFKDEKRMMFAERGFFDAPPRETSTPTDPFRYGMISRNLIIYGDFLQAFSRELGYREGGHWPNQWEREEE